MAGEHPFVKWIIRSGKTRQAIARELGVSKGYLTLILQGKRSPSLDLTLRIGKMTKGAITPPQLQQRQPRAA